MKKLIIIGASGFGREVAWLVERINKVKETWNLMGFLDDESEGYCVTLNWQAFKAFRSVFKHGRRAA